MKTPSSIHPVPQQGAQSAARKLKNNRPNADAFVSDRLIDAAEALFGAHGIEGVSLRQISMTAGTGNNYAVQYHFGDIGGLIRAILNKRVVEVEVKRAQLLMQAKASKRLDARALMDVLYRPLIEHLDQRGERAFARFVLALHVSPSGAEHARGVFHLMPIAEHVLDLLYAAYPEIPAALQAERQRQIAIMTLTSILDRRNPWTQDPSDMALIDNALDMATAALLAPVAPSVRAVMGATKTRKKKGE